MIVQFDATDAELSLFLDEAGEQLATLSDGVLAMERDAADATLVQAIFRAAHTLKGSAATIGHARMASLTHAIESVLDAVRHATLTPTSAVTDSLLAAVDALHILTDEVRTRQASALATEPLVARLHEVATTHAPAPPTPQRHSLTAEQRQTLAALLATDGVHALHVEVMVDPSSAWSAVRAYQAMMELAPLGTLVCSWPTDDALQQGECDGTLTAVIATAHPPKTIRAAVASVTDVIAVTVQSWAGVVGDSAPVPADAASPAAHDHQRQISLGPEARGASLDEQLVIAGQRLTVASRMVKVDIARLDELMNLVGELVIDRGRLARAHRRLTAARGDMDALDGLDETIQHLSRICDDLHAQVMLARLLPVERVFHRFPRMVRDLARTSGKSIRLVMEGEQTGLDRSVIDEIGDPLLHLLRNAADHGIDTPEQRLAVGKPAEGTITLSARHEEQHIVLEVRDDGRGIDPQTMRDTAVRTGILTAQTAARLDDDAAINLIFAPGFSSAAQVTDVSGRGVGMDIVRTNIEKLNGTVAVTTTRGQGTTVTITLPLTLVIIRALLVGVADAVYAIPLASVRETLRVSTDQLRTVQGRAMALVHERALPLLWLSEVFPRRAPPATQPRAAWQYVVSVRTGQTDFGLVVDALVGEHEVVIKPLDGVLRDTEGIAGATILGDGRVSMIVDVPGVVRLAA